MEEICNSIYVTQSQYLALSSKKSTSAALFLLDCFYTKEEQLHMTVNGTVGKGKINGTLLDSILGINNFFKFIFSKLHLYPICIISVTSV